ncbi:MAG: pyruvate, phosphate dikinase [Phycisphaeraceae bacterium]|nr:pyruvate, phosphate dikinase [Phycisphaeraceae bacterium]
MERSDQNVSTGLKDLDTLLTGLLPGDNVVWRVNAIADYQAYVIPFCQELLSRKKELVYFRFAEHAPLIASQQDVTIVEIDPQKGFEHFIVGVHDTISRVGRGGHYVFDSMSDLTSSCHSDRMIGNFFKLTCPYLRELEAIAYFSFMRYKHSFHAAELISNTTQVLLDVYNHDGIRYVQPFKVEGRYARSMFKLHEQMEDRLVSVKESLNITKVLSSVPWPGLRSASYRMIGVWDRMFIQAESVLEAFEKPEYPSEKAEGLFFRLIKLVISRDERILSIARTYFSLADIIYIWKRMIGTGFIGGKSVGMLLAHAVLRKESPGVYETLEEHDSFYIGSDVFYTFLVENNLWQEKQKQKDPDRFLDHIDLVHEKILKGSFPEYLVQRFADMLDYYGQTPIVVRSSSLLEDAFGNSFSGKYESVFCPNQGTHQERLEAFLNAAKTVYASAMSVRALSYRKSRGVLDQDEQMALLVQRVSGIPRAEHYYPQLAGVGFSFNPYAWSPDIDPRAGMIRLVYGLGTRAVEQSDTDYTRVVALNAPEKRPESNSDEVMQYSQRKVHHLDLTSNCLTKTEFNDLASEEPFCDLFACRDIQAERFYRERGIKNKPMWSLTFDRLIAETEFISDIRTILDTIRMAFGSNVDIEFTCNFYRPDAYKICLVQCRPFQVDETDIINVRMPDITDPNTVLKAQGAVVGRSNPTEIERIIFVDPAPYGQLSESQRYSVARIIGKLFKPEQGQRRTVLMGPGRWGTSTPSLGVPVSYSEIRSVYAICEIDSMHEGLVPDLSLGTHFFNEMVETGMIYLGYFGSRKGNVLRQDLLRSLPNVLGELLPESGDWARIIHVIDCPIEGRSVNIVADPVGQVGVVYFR